MHFNAQVGVLIALLTVTVHRLPVQILHHPVAMPQFIFYPPFIYCCHKSNEATYERR